jgi:hypothetical protein
MKTICTLAAVLFLSFSTMAQTSNYHYQRGYTVTDSISQVPGTTLRLYPTLADKYVNVYVQMHHPKPFTVTIYDAYNNVIKQWNEDANASYEKAVDVTKLANGKYYVKAAFGTGYLRQSFTVAH